MLRLFPILLLFLSIALSTSASVISLPASIQLTDAGLAAGNASLNADVPDPRFSIAPSFDTSPLPIDSCLMNVLYFMTEIAYGDFTQQHPAKTYKVPDYNEVEIVTGTAMTARFLIWGIWLAMEFMMHNDQFYTVLWTLRWEERILGTITLQPSAPRPSSLPSTSNIHPSSLPFTNTNTNTTTPTPPLSAQFALSIDFFPDGKPLSNYEVFMSCYTGLLHCAQLPTTALMQPFGNRSPIGGVSLHMFKYGPSLAYAYVIRTLSHIPRYLLTDSGGFREVNFDLDLDGGSCARGAITKGRV